MSRSDKKRPENPLRAVNLFAGGQTWVDKDYDERDLTERQAEKPPKLQYRASLKQFMRLRARDAGWLAAFDDNEIAELFRAHLANTNKALFDDLPEPRHITKQVGLIRAAMQAAS
jgi:hypothetical protein